MLNYEEQKAIYEWYKINNPETIKDAKKLECVKTFEEIVEYLEWDYRNNKIIITED